MNELTETWLRDIGFRWEQHDRCPYKHWILWLGMAVAEEGRAAGSDSLGVEVTKGDDAGTWWYCWIRADYAGRYSRLIHVRHIKSIPELCRLIEALAGQEFRRDYVWYGGLLKPNDAARYKKDAERLDVKLAMEWGKRVEIQDGLDPAKNEKVRP